VAVNVDLPQKKRQGLARCQVAALARSGFGADQRVSQFIGIPRNVGPGQVTIPGTGPGGYRVPDFNPTLRNATRGTAVEVKIRPGWGPHRSSGTWLTTFRGQNVPLEIFTNVSLPGSGDLFRWIRAGQVIIRPIP
jgi:hypothetical protein